MQDDGNLEDRICGVACAKVLPAAGAPDHRVKKRRDDVDEMALTPSYYGIFALIETTSRFTAANRNTARSHPDRARPRVVPPNLALR